MIIDWAVVESIKREGGCGIVRGEMVCQLPKGYKGLHRDGEGTFTKEPVKRVKASWNRWAERHEFDIQCD